MLALSRTPGETLFIGLPGPDQIRVRIIKVRGERVVVGIDAPRSTPIYRAEIAASFEGRKEDVEHV